MYVLKDVRVSALAFVINLYFQFLSPPIPRISLS